MPLSRPHLPAVIRACAWIAVAVPAQSVFWTGVPFVGKASVALFAGLAAWRPQLGLCVLAALLPFVHAIATRIWEVADWRITETLVLVFLAAVLFPGRIDGRRRGVNARILAPAAAFAVVVAGTVAVQFVIERAWQDHWPSFLAGALRYLTIDYLVVETDPRPAVVGMAFIPAAAALLEGMLLACVAARLLQDDPPLRSRLVTTIGIAAVGAAIMSGAAVLEIASANGMSPWTVVVDARVSGVIPSLGSSAAYFTMMAVLAAGLGLRGGPWRAISWWTAMLLLGAAGWLTKTRSAIIALMAALGAFALWWRLRMTRHVVAVAAAVAAMVVIAWLVLSLGVLIRPEPGESVHLRVVLAQGALRMIGAYPFFGVGLQQFDLRYHEFRTALPGYVEDDPHNQWLGIGAELGLMGLGTFIWFIAAALIPAIRAASRRPVSAENAAIIAASIAFMVTWLSHQPLNAPAAGLTFWLLLGAAASYATNSGTGRTSMSWLSAAIVLIVAAGSAVSIPARVRAELDQIDFTGVEYGFHDWEIDGAGTEYRWSSGHSTFFLPATMRLINLPVAASLKGAPDGTIVVIEVDGQPAGRLHLTDEEWHQVRLVAPENDRPSWRIDLYVTPPWIPKAIDASSGDGRTLGVRVGRPDLRR